jgi:hypothetical protein
VKERAMIKRLILSVVFCFCLGVLVGTPLLFTACNRKPATEVSAADKNKQTLARIKRGGIVLAAAVDQGIAMEKDLAAAGEIDSQLEPQIRQWLSDAKVTIDGFNERAKAYTVFDPTVQADVAAVARDAVALLSKLNDEGVLRIKNPRSRMIARGVLAGAAVAVNMFQVLSEQPQ